MYNHFSMLALGPPVLPSTATIPAGHWRRGRRKSRPDDGAPNAKSRSAREGPTAKPEELMPDINNEQGTVNINSQLSTPFS